MLRRGNRPSVGAEAQRLEPRRHGHGVEQLHWIDREEQRKNNLPAFAQRPCRLVSRHLGMYAVLDRKPLERARSALPDTGVPHFGSPLQTWPFATHGLHLTALGRRAPKEPTTCGVTVESPFGRGPRGGAELQTHVLVFRHLGPLRQSAGFLRTPEGLLPGHGNPLDRPRRTTRSGSSRTEGLRSAHPVD